MVQLPHRDAHKRNCIDTLVKCWPDAPFERQFSIVNWLWDFLQLVTASGLHAVYARICVVITSKSHVSCSVAVILAYHLLLRASYEICAVFVNMLQLTWTLRR